MLTKQRTIKSSVDFKGKGLHTGLETILSIKPSEANKGIVFQRIDLENKPLIPALAENVLDTSRGTVLGINEVKVSTVEHILAVLYSLGIDNALLEINGPEVPILDGSSLKFFEGIEKAGIQELDAEKVYYEFNEKYEYSDPEKGVSITIYPDSKASFDVKIGYDSPILKNQYATLENLEDFKTEIAPCRTFVFFREIENLAKNNLIKGGDVDNAIIIVDHSVTQEEIDRVAELFNKKGQLRVESGILNNVALRFDNEQARHKLLDLIGDMSLLGMPFLGRVIASHPGHYCNTEFVKQIRKIIKKDRNKVLPPKVNLYGTPVIDIEGIKKTIPHRFPFLLVDKIMVLTDNEVVGIKNVTMNEPFFQGHFPEEAVMPGVLQLEAMAQCGGVLALHSVPDPELYSTYFISIDKVKYRKKVIPGDILVFKLKLIAPIRRGIVQMDCQAFVGNDLVCSGEMMAQIVKNKG
ncbi:MAG: bifunctional UDP-3-O-[3-hydroxymyristoyl] N-acetylglucosamine deacetylase/3-hydroxyacyl-ACP dehydratase [Bacteroidales bacterium]|nr:bifunctional UDP-3-O-[3-hydroxymyristoyl] N-acetylglucosamine deacetylase/3-hydroxyacyl-ACP dehydratase [Bacteroidales bacterium]